MLKLLSILCALMFSSAAYGSPQVAMIAMQWYKCPPVNPYNPQACMSACCHGGSNWDLTCICFVEGAARKATGKKDPQLLAGFPQAGNKFGSAIVSFQSMSAVGRARTTSNDISVGAAVFFSIVGFPPGHIAINSGIKDLNGDPLIISTGGGGLTGIRLMPLSVLSTLPGWKYLGWADI